MSAKIRRIALFLLCLTALLQAPFAAQAQTQALAATPETQNQTQNEILQNQLPASLFFTPLEIDIIRNATQGVVSVLPPEPDEKGEGVEGVPVIPERRLIRLSGLVYQNPQKWTVWINGYRVTPDNLLPEIQGIRVEEKKVYLLWTDERKNQIISITLHPHQTYDIDSGILLPG